MCTNIAEKTDISGSAKGAGGWFALDKAYIAFDHPLHAQLDHALTLDFVNEATGIGARVAVELNAESARRLANSILAAVEEAETQGVA
jgi:Family of unknown function (DUF6295)